MNERRIRYRTADGLYHLWTQEEIDAYIEQSLCAAVSPSRHDVSTGPHEETILTIEMLYDLFSHRGRASQVDKATKDELLGRIERMGEPLKEMVQELEVQP